MTMFLTQYKKKSPYWQIVFSKNGKRTSLSTGETERSKAEIVFAQFKGEDVKPIQQEEPPEENSILLSEFKSEYMDYARSIFSDGYIERSIEPTFKALFEAVGDIPLSKLNNRLLEKFILSVFKEKKYAAALYYRTIKAALNKAKTWEMINDNFKFNFRLPKIQQQPTLFISFDELIKIISNVQTTLDDNRRNNPKEILRADRYKDVYLFAFFTGMRAGEMVSLTWDNIDLKKNLIQIGSAEFYTKSRKVRYIPISDNLKTIIIKYTPQEIIPGKTLLFTQLDGNGFTVTRLSRIFKEAVKRTTVVNQSVHLHTLRASFGSFLLQSGVPIQSISKILGHQSIQTTEKYYAQLTIDNLHDAVKIFNTIKLDKAV